MSARDSITVRAPLGMRFWDQAGGRHVRDGLVGEIWPEGAPGARVGAYSTVSGVLAFRDLPGLRAHEWPGEGDGPDPIPFVAQIEDPRGRFVTSVHRVELPLEGGLYPPEPDEPEVGVATGAHLFPSPQTGARSGQFSIRAALVLPDGTPAVHAMVVVTPEGEGADPLYGVADGSGRVVVIGAYPPVESELDGQDGASGRATLHEQTWRFVVRVRYAPQDAPVPLGAHAPYQDAVFGQGEAMIVPDEGQGTVSQLEVVVRFGEELVLRTVSESRDGTLVIEPAL